MEISIALGNLYITPNFNLFSVTGAIFPSIQLRETGAKLFENAYYGPEKNLYRDNETANVWLRVWRVTDRRVTDLKSLQYKAGGSKEDLNKEPPISNSAPKLLNHSSFPYYMTE